MTTPVVVTPIEETPLPGSTPTPTPAPTATLVPTATPALANFSTISALNENVGGMGYGFRTGAADVDSTNRRYLNLRSKYPEDTTHVISIDTQTGNLTEGPPLSTSFLGMKYDEGSGKLFGITNCCPNQFVSVN